jgi:hypothetical protein
MDIINKPTLKREDGAASEPEMSPVSPPVDNTPIPTSPSAFMSLRIRNPENSEAGGSPVRNELSNLLDRDGFLSDSPCVPCEGASCCEIMAEVIQNLANDLCQYLLGDVDFTL